MKAIIRSFIASLLLLTCFAAFAQSNTTTIILVRHAEKETAASSDMMMKSDPPLSTAGKTRAKNLVVALSEFHPDAIFSTSYQRTKATVTPLATQLHLDIRLYDPRKQEAFAGELQSMQGKTIVVCGHSNTIPKLVNLLIGLDGKYADLDESVYNKIFIVRITDGIPTVEIREY